MSIDAAIKEYVDVAVAQAMEKAFAQKQNDMEECHIKNEPQIIRGISGLAQFLNISIVTAQKLKNQGKIPYRQVGRVLVFVADEVLNAMKKKSK